MGKWCWHSAHVSVFVLAVLAAVSCTLAACSGPVPIRQSSCQKDQDCYEYSSCSQRPGACTCIDNVCSFAAGPPDDTLEVGCRECHGSVANSAPPQALNGGVERKVLGVGAHQVHLTAGRFTRPVSCSDCHIVPETVDAPSHDDGDAQAEVVFSDLASVQGEMNATWRRSEGTCLTYCHGVTLAGGEQTQPRWTQDTVDCGACHGLPPPSPHPQQRACELCHVETAGPGLTLANKLLHIDGSLQVGEMLCGSCHGDPSRSDALLAWPPLDLEGRMESDQIGAHAAHMQPTIGADVVCSSCHRVPESYGDPGHVDDADNTAEVLYAGLAVAQGGPAPVYNALQRGCQNTYCHGVTLSGGSNGANAGWTQGSAASLCGSCHGTPPGTAVHSSVTSGTPCGSCHPSASSSTPLTVVNRQQHIDGTVQASELACVSCHGGLDNQTGAPPVAVNGDTSTAVRGVGAHSSHLAASSWRADVVCDSCHQVPTSTSDGHNDGDPAEITWGGAAQAQGVVASWNGANCTTYCHGATLGGGAATAPLWTRVDGSQSACGSCHGNPPPGHSSGNCNDCHAASINHDGTFVDAGAHHINGLLEATRVHPEGWEAAAAHGFATLMQEQDCRQCHGDDLTGGSSGKSCDECHTAGWRTDCTRCHGGVDTSTGAPPYDLRDVTLRSSQTVGAHTEHSTETDHMAYDCIHCHNKPTDVLSAGHMFDSTPQKAEVRFGNGLSPAGSYTDPGCSTLYCHGNGRSNGSQANYTGQISDCTHCHGTAPSSGEHNLHVNSENYSCGSCHLDVASNSTTIVGPALHVDGTVNVRFRQGGISISGGRCNGSCHGEEHRNDDW